MYRRLVDELIGVEDSELTDRFRALELERRRIDAEMAAIVREGERRGIHTVDGHRTMKHWVRAQINCPMGDAVRLRRLAAALDTVDDLGDALRDGHIGTPQANELARLRAHPRCGDQLASSAPLLLQHAEHLSFEEFRIVARRWEALADLDGAQRDDDISAERRTASVVELNGSIDVRASGGSAMIAAEMVGIFQQFVEAEFAKDVAARTEQFGADAPAAALPRTDAQRRFDALVAIYRAAVLAPADGVAPKPVVNVLVGLGTLEHLLADHGLGARPADPLVPDLMVERLESSNGVRLAPHDVVRAALQGVVRRVVIDAAGVVVDAGRKRRLFTGAARDLALVLVHQCGHPGCTVPGDLCQVDHMDEWQRDNGVTATSNADARCTPHNPWKSRNRVRSRRDSQGYIVNTRFDGTMMLPVGRRVLDDGESDSDDADFSESELDVLRIATGWGGARMLRVAYCDLHTVRKLPFPPAGS
jgi:hypothetical protein